MPQCIVNNCKNSTQSCLVLGQKKKKKKRNNVTYHRFPKNEQLKSLWLNILGLEAESVKTEVRICSNFAEDAFYILHGTKRLQPSALPSKGTRIEIMKTAMTLLTNINPGPPRAPQTFLLSKTIVSMAKDLQNL